LQRKPDTSTCYRGSSRYWHGWQKEIGFGGWRAQQRRCGDRPYDWRLD